MSPYQLYKQKTSLTRSIRTLISTKRPLPKEYIQSSRLDQCALQASQSEQYVTLEIPTESHYQLEMRRVYAPSSWRCKINSHFAWKKRFANFGQNCLARHPIQRIPTCCHRYWFNNTPCWKCIVNLLS